MSIEQPKKPLGEGEKSTVDESWITLAEGNGFSDRGADSNAGAQVWCTSNE